MPESILIVLPETFEEFLFSMTIAQDYIMAQRVRKPDAEVSVHCPRDFAFFLKGFIVNGVNVIHDLNEDVLSKADCIQVLDRERVLPLATPLRMHQVDAMGVIMGASAIRVMPIGEWLGAPNSLYTVLWVPRHITDARTDMGYKDAPQFMGEMAQHLVQHGGVIKALPMDIPLEDAWKEISQAAVVVGMMGGLTALAAMLGKPVFDVCPPSLCFSEWAHKWEIFNYRVVTLEPNQLAPERLAAMAADFAIPLLGREMIWERSVTADFRLVGVGRVRTGTSPSSVASAAKLLERESMKDRVSAPHVAQSATA